jgi:hypothetical protein
MYALHTNNAGAIGTLHRLDPPTSTDWRHLVKVPLDANDAQYQAFLAWIKALFGPVELTNWPPNAIVCLAVGPLVAWCKHAGVMLFAGQRGSTFGTERYQEAGTTRLLRLRQAWAFDPSSGDTEPASGLVGRPSYMWVPNQVWHELNSALPDDTQEVQKISSWSIERTFVYVDVSDFSKSKPGQQALIINSLVYIVDQKDFWPGRARYAQEAIQARMCLGDGYIFVFKNAMDGTYFAAYLAQLIEALVARKSLLPVEFHFRMGVHIGDVYTFWDPGREDWNYIGDGINGGARVLTAIEKTYDDQVYISGAVRQAIMATTPQDTHTCELLTHLHNRGRRKDKHGQPWRVYEIAHTALCAETVAGVIARLIVAEGQAASA